MTVNVPPLALARIGQLVQQRGVGGMIDGQQLHAGLVQPSQILFHLALVRAAQLAGQAPQ